MSVDETKECVSKGLLPHTLRRCRRAEAAEAELAQERANKEVLGRAAEESIALLEAEVARRQQLLDDAAGAFTREKKQRLASEARVAVLEKALRGIAEPPIGDEAVCSAGSIALQMQAIARAALGERVVK